MDTFHPGLEAFEVLLVEDSPGDVRLIREAFKEAKVHVRLHVVTDGVEAMKFLNGHGTNSIRPDLILLDLNLPKKDGREVLAEIKADSQLRTIPVVILTTSGADEDVRRSYLLHANCYITKGTLFLDEVGELPLDLQPKLLRALQEREIERLGGHRPVSVNIRLIAATNRDLAQMVAQREFRSDLYYRLKVFPILAPSLRERRSDIPALVRHFVAKYSEKLGKDIIDIQPEAMDALVKWAWPGNIRELENFIERAVILTRGSTLHVILAELDTSEALDRDSFTLEEAEREHIVQALREAGGLISGPHGAARRLALKRTTLHSKMKKLGISRDEYLV